MSHMYPDTLHIQYSTHEVDKYKCDVDKMKTLLNDIHECILQNQTVSSAL